MAEHPVAPRPAEVSAALRRWLSDRFGGPVEDAEPPSALSGGFDFWIFSVRFQGRALPPEWASPLVARLPPSPERFALLERESRLQSWVADHGYPAPAVLEVVAPGELFASPVQVMARVPGGTMADAMTARPWRIGGLIETLADLHARLHALPVPPWAGNAEWSLAERRLGLVRHVADLVPDSGLRSGLEEVGRLLPRLEVSDPVICHGDFHPLNVLVAGAGASVIDWSDSGIGDRHGDVVRTAWLFGFSAAAAPRRTQRAVLRATAPGLARRYLAAYRRRIGADARRLDLWLPLQLLHVCAQAVADDRELFGPSRAGRDFRPGLEAWAGAHFRRAIETATADRG